MPAPRSRRGRLRGVQYQLRRFGEEGDTEPYMDAPPKECPTGRRRRSTMPWLFRDSASASARRGRCVGSGAEDAEDGR